MTNFNVLNYTLDQLQSRDGAEVLHIGKSNLVAYVVTRDNRNIARPYLINFNGRTDARKETYLDIILKEPEAPKTLEEEIAEFAFAQFLKALIYNQLQKPTNTLNELEVVEEQFGITIAKDWQDDYVYKIHELEMFIKNSKYGKYLNNEIK